MLTRHCLTLLTAEAPARSGVTSGLAEVGLGARDSIWGLLLFKTSKNAVLKEAIQIFPLPCPPPRILKDFHALFFHFQKVHRAIQRFLPIGVMATSAWGSKTASQGLRAPRAPARLAPSLPVCLSCSRTQQAGREGQSERRLQRARLSEETSACDQVSLPLLLKIESGRR